MCHRDQCCRIKKHLHFHCRWIPLAMDGRDWHTDTSTIGYLDGQQTNEKWLTLSAASHGPARVSFQHWIDSPKRLVPSRRTSIGAAVDGFYSQSPSPIYRPVLCLCSSVCLWAPRLLLLKRYPHTHTRVERSQLKRRRLSPLRDPFGSLGLHCSGFCLFSFFPASNSKTTFFFSVCRSTAESSAKWIR